MFHVKHSKKNQTKLDLQLIPIEAERQEKGYWREQKTNSCQNKACFVKKRCGKVINDIQKELTDAIHLFSK